MSPAPVPDCTGIFRLDVEMFGTHGVTSPYVIDAPEPIVIDTGPATSRDELLAALSDLDIPREALSYILPTHAHLDHAGGAGHLADACPDATVLCHAAAAPYLTDERRLGRLQESVERAIGMRDPYGEPTVIDPDRVRTLGDGGSVDLGDRRLDVIDAPGHAPHQLCLYDRRDDVLFSADANGMSLDDAGHRPTTPPPDFDLEVALETVDRLRGLEPETVLYGHFGWGEPGEGTGELEAYREMLPRFVGAVERAREEHGDDGAAITGALDERWHHWALQTDVAGILRYLDGRGS